MNGNAKNYADALFALAHDEGIDELIRTQLSEVCWLFDENPDYIKLLSAPNIPKEERVAALDEAFSGRVHPWLLNWLKLLCERGYIYAYRDCARSYQVSFNAAHGILAVKVIAAVLLRVEQMEKLRKRLCELTGKRVELEGRMDPSVLGGIRLQYEDVELDGTVRQRLEGLKKTLSDTVL